MNGRYVLIRGQVFRWEEKAPYVDSVRSIYGGIEFLPDEGKVKCHECGQWFRSLGQHIRHAHAKSPAQYKDQHGLRKTSAICSPATRSKLSESIRRTRERHPEMASAARLRAMQDKAARVGNPGPAHSEELMNERGLCAAQLVAKVRKIAADLGHTPSAANVGASWGRIKRVFGSYRALCEAAGLVANDQLKSRYDPMILIELLRDFYVLNKRLPRPTDWGTGSLPSGSAYDKHFGSRMNAYRAAGFGDVAKNRQGRRR